MALLCVVHWIISGKQDLAHTRYPLQPQEYPDGVLPLVFESIPWQHQARETCHPMARKISSKGKEKIIFSQQSQSQFKWSIAFARKSYYIHSNYNLCAGPQCSELSPQDLLCGHLVTQKLPAKENTKCGKIGKQFRPKKQKKTKICDKRKCRPN